MHFIFATAEYHPPHPKYDLVWQQLHPLLSEHHLWTALCGVLILCVIVSFYRKLREISPALVPLVLCLIIFIMLTLWTQSRTEPKFLSPLVDVVARFLPAAPTPASASKPAH